MAGPLSLPPSVEAEALQLLRQSNNYITFHINVMNQAQASDTYAPPGAATVENRRGVRMFDANV